jgi:hypothetical protein
MWIKAYQDFSWGESPLGMWATVWRIVPAMDDVWWWMWSSWWNENWQGKPKYLEKTCPSATLSTTNPTWPDLGLNVGCRGGKLVTNLTYGMAIYQDLCIIILNSSCPFFDHDIPSNFKLIFYSVNWIMPAEITIPPRFIPWFTTLVIPVVKQKQLKVLMFPFPTNFCHLNSVVLFNRSLKIFVISFIFNLLCVSKIHI